MSPKVGAPPGRGPRARHSPHPAEGTAAVGAAALPGLIPWEHSLAHRQAQLLTLLEVGASLICGFWPPGPHPGTLTLALHTHLSPLRPSHTHAFVQPVSPPTSPLRGSPVSSLLSHTFHFLSSLLLRSAHHSAVSGLLQNSRLSRSALPITRRSVGVPFMCISRPLVVML